MRILYLNNGDSGCDYYRIQLPARELAANGHEVRLPQHRMTYEPVGPIAYAQAAGLPLDEDLEWADVIVARQLAHPGIVMHWRRFGSFAPTIYDTDDDVYHVESANPALSVFVDPTVREGVRRMMQSAAAVTVTTDHLANCIAEEVPDANVVVVPNYIDGAYLTLPVRARAAHPSVGWTVSSSHIADLLAHVAALREFFVSHPDVEYHEIGVRYAEHWGGPLPKFRHTDWLPINDYFTALAFDVGIAPLSRCSFNRCKSPNKAIEYGACGIPTVAFAETAYDGYIVDGMTGFLVRNRAEWVTYLDLLTSDRDLAAKMGRAARIIARRHVIQTGWQAWERAFRSVL